MINENQKSYCICDGCSKLEDCKYYKDVTQTIHSFINTPLNIHFPMCSEYQLILNISKPDRPEIKEFFQKQLEALWRYYK